MQTVLSIFLFALAIAYVEYRLKSIRKDDSDDKKDAFDFFATKEELKKAVKRIEEQGEAYRQTIDEKLASVEQKAFFAPQEEKTVEEVVEEEPDPSVIFFRWPGDDGSFDDSQRLTAKTDVRGKILMQNQLRPVCAGTDVLQNSGRSGSQGLCFVVSKLCHFEFLQSRLVRMTKEEAARLTDSL